MQPFLVKEKKKKKKDRAEVLMVVNWEAGAEGYGEILNQPGLHYKILERR